MTPHSFRWQLSSFWIPPTVHSGDRNPFAVELFRLSCHLECFVFSALIDLSYCHWGNCTMYALTNLHRFWKRKQFNLLFHVALKNLENQIFYIKWQATTRNLKLSKKSPSFDEKFLPYVWKPSSHINWIYWAHTKQNNFLTSPVYNSGFKGFVFQMFLTKFWLFFRYFMCSQLKLAHGFFF